MFRWRQVQCKLFIQTGRGRTVQLNLPRHAFATGRLGSEITMCRAAASYAALAPSFLRARFAVDARLVFYFLVVIIGADQSVLCMHAITTSPTCRK